jgi:hypothetical protein
VIASIVTLLAVTVVMAAMTGLAMSGFRAGDRPGDATVTAALEWVPHPDGPRRVVVAAVRNSGPGAVLAGLSAHRSRAPGWLGAGMTVTVPHCTGRARYGPGAQVTLGVVGPGETGHWPVPAPGRGGRGGRCHLVAVIGQAGGRLRVIRLPVAPAGTGTAARITGWRPWLDDGQVR